jgi:hypothetical protein
MDIKRDLNVTCTEGDLEIQMGRVLTTFSYKGQDKFVFRNVELDSLIALLTTAKKELDSFYNELKNHKET